MVAPVLQTLPRAPERRVWPCRSSTELEMQAAQVLELQKRLQERFPNAQPVLYRTSGAVATGVSALDGLLPGSGLPRGRVTLWTPGGGVSAVLRAASSHVVAEGERAAWIDAQRSVTGDSWERGPMLLRPKSELDALMCAEELLRCGGFALVVLNGVGRAFEHEAVRLSRAVRDGGCAFVVVAQQSSIAHLRLQSRIQPHNYRWAFDPFGDPTQVNSVRVEVQAQSMGWQGRTSFVLPVLTFEQRAALDPLLRDRRGGERAAAKRKRKAQRGTGG